MAIQFLGLMLLLMLTACRGTLVEESLEWGSQSQAPFVILRGKFHQSIWNEAMAEASVLYQDGGHSIPVEGGALWVFGDTFLGQRNEKDHTRYTGAVSCTMAFLKEDSQPFPPVFEYLCDEKGVARSPFEFLPGESFEKNRIWPLGGIRLEGQHYLYYSLIEITEGTPPWNFRALGSGLARSRNALGDYERLMSQGDWRFPINPSQILQQDGWLYLFEAGKKGEKRGVVLARVEPGRIKDPWAYEFYTGSGPVFSPNREDARLMAKDVYGQVSIAWNDYLEMYIMACASDFFRPKEIAFRVAKAPWGPFSPPVAEIRIPETQGKTHLIYCAFLHPELFRKEGRVMVLTYCPMVDKGFSNPEMVEVEIEARGPFE